MLSTRWRPQPTAGNDVAATWPLMLPEWEVIVAGRAHVLLEGEKYRVRQTIFALASQVPRTVTCWHAGAIWPVTPHTFIVENVETLSPAEQRELLDRLSAVPSCVQVISTSEGSVYEAVTRGAFLDDLYYRLNIVRVELPSAFVFGDIGK